MQSTGKPSRLAANWTGRKNKELGGNRVGDEVTENRKPTLPESLGFREGTSSVHTSRTMMLAELSLNLDHVGVKEKTQPSQTTMTVNFFCQKKRSELGWGF
jgi:hypothetical protein